MPINVFKGITDEDAAKVVDGLAPKGADRSSCIEQVKKLYELFRKSDCTMLEVWYSLLQWILVPGLSALRLFYMSIEIVVIRSTHLPRQLIKCWWQPMQSWTLMIMQHLGKRKFSLCVTLPRKTLERSVISTFFRVFLS